MHSGLSGLQQAEPHNGRQRAPGQPQLLMLRNMLSSVCAMQHVCVGEATLKGCAEHVLCSMCVWEATLEGSAGQILSCLSCSRLTVRPDTVRLAD